MDVEGPAGAKNNPQASAPAPDSTTIGSQVREILRRLGAVSILGIISVTIPAVGGIMLLWKLNAVGDWLKSHQDTGPFIYIAGFALLSGLALLPTYAQAILGGWAFGFAIGFPAALAGLVGGATIGYMIARRASGQRVTSLIREYPKMRMVYDALMGSGFGRALLLVFLLRLPPNAPFAATNLLLAATRVPPLAYTIGTLFGLAPRTAIVIYIASKLSKLDLSESKPWGFVIGSFAVSVAVLLILGYLANRAIHQMSKDQPPTPSA